MDGAHYLIVTTYTILGAYARTRPPPSPVRLQRDSEGHGIMLGDVGQLALNLGSSSRWGVPHLDITHDSMTHRSRTGQPDREIRQRDGRRDVGQVLT